MDELGAMSPYMSMVGNAAGTALNYLATEAHASKQQARQEQMNRAAFRRNEIAIMNQAQLEKNSLERAGINPADAGANGSPVQQAGSAGMGQSGMASVFAGLSELVAALKAPTEIEKMVAETGRNEAETGKIGEEVKKISEDIRGTRNANEMFEASRDFAKEHGAAVFDGYRGWLKSVGAFDNLPTRTKQTIDSLADGEIDVGLGELEALKKLVDSQKNLSERDKQTASDAIDSLVSWKRLSDSGVLDALFKMPEQMFIELRARVADLYASAVEHGASASAISQKQREDIINLFVRAMDDPAVISALQKEKKNISAALGEKYSYLVESLGTENDAESRQNQDIKYGLAKYLFELFKFGTMLVGGSLLGKAAGKAAAGASSSAVTAPTDKQIFDINKSRTFGKTFDFR